MNEVLLKIEGLKKSFGSLQVLKGLTTTIEKGEVVVMIGPSGGGDGQDVQRQGALAKISRECIEANGILEL